MNIDIDKPLEFDPSQFAEFLSSTGNVKYDLYNAEEISRAFPDRAELMREIGLKVNSMWPIILRNLNLNSNHTTPPNIVFLSQQDFNATLGEDGTGTGVMFAAESNSIFIDTDALMNPEYKDILILRIFENLINSTLNTEVLVKGNDGNLEVMNRMYKLFSSACELGETDLIRYFGGYIFYGVVTGENIGEITLGISGDVMYPTEMYAITTSAALLYSMILALNYLNDPDAKVAIENRFTNYSHLNNMAKTIIKRNKKFHNKKAYPIMIIPDETIEAAKIVTEIDFKTIAEENPIEFKKVILALYKALHDVDFNPLNNLRDQYKDSKEIKLSLLVKTIREYLDNSGNFKRAFEILIEKAKENIDKYRAYLPPELVDSPINLFGVLSRMDVIDALGTMNYTVPSLRLKINIPNDLEISVESEGPSNPVEDIFKIAANPKMSDFKDESKTTSSEEEG